ncbi:YdcF family protein [Paenibacillus sp. F411]|uniref:YdcF family protein n=1 Tax=Paenibacillus sp. F411 TaxID=2820239 RepID=UPI001AAEB813|nr:YdcF family protein [Paenibacillus sp. F411]MBO2943055.1 YdcF family protein [Paenibacillus sp. F411]
MWESKAVQPSSARPRHLRLHMKIWTRLGLVVILLGVIWCGYVYTRIGQAESTLDDTVEVGIILGASMWGEKPSPGLKERLDYARTLYDQGYFEEFIVTGGLDAPEYPYTEAEGMRNDLVSQGIPEENIHLENEATSTYENLLFSRAIMEEQGWEQAVIITHDYHGARAMEIAEVLDYRNPKLAVTTSNVLPLTQQKGREILAFSKWRLDRMLLAMGWKE